MSNLQSLLPLTPKSLTQTFSKREGFYMADNKSVNFASPPLGRLGGAKIIPIKAALANPGKSLKIE